MTSEEGNTGTVMQRHGAEAGAGAEQQRTFLFLQGHPSYFARRLADELERRGHRALRINFCLGDTLCWLGRKSVSYRGRLRDWPGWLRAFIQREQVTDILYYADRKPYHIVAKEEAEKIGIRAFAYEFGYMRPDWITIERNGMSAYSHFPNNPGAIRAIARDHPKPDMQMRYPYSKGVEIFHEVTYNLATFFTPFLYPFYDSDRYYNTLVEYISGIPGLFLEKRNHKRAEDLIQRIIVEHKTPFFLFPLQLQSDYQLRDNAPFSHQKEAIEQVITSFSRHAPAQTHLFFKQHPLDNGWERWGKIIRHLARKQHLAERVHLLIGGDLAKLLRQAKGCVLINSTVGMQALSLGCPVKALGTAIYDVEGLCHQKSLDSFWQNPTRPDTSLVHDLQRALAGTIQVKGNFFTAAGQKAAIPQMAQMLLTNAINAGAAYENTPPRLPQKAPARQQELSGSAAIKTEKFPSI